MSALASLQVDSLLSYAAAIVFPALDAVLPVLPSETIIITLGVATAGSADPRIALLVACAAAGAFLGDNLCYVLGRRFGPWIDRRFFREDASRVVGRVDAPIDRDGLQPHVLAVGADALFDLRRQLAGRRDDQRANRVPRGRMACIRARGQFLQER